MRITREFYIPKGAVKIADKQSDAVAYVYEQHGNPIGMVFFGRQSRPVIHCRFRSVERRETRIRELFASRQRHQKAKADARAERKAIERKLEVGHVLKSTWGYEQTNIDFYQVTKLIGKTMVEVRRIKSMNTEETGWASGRCVPDIDNFCGEPMRRRAGDGYVSIDRGRCARLWDGTPANWTAYH